MEQVVNEEPPAGESPPDELPLLPCHVCSRTFLPKPLKKHIPICEQTARRKRKPFDSLKQRVEGTDMAPFYQKSYLKKSNPEISSQAQAGDVYGNNNKQSKWREKHFELQNTIKNAKGTKTDMTTNHSNSTSTTPYRKASHLNVNQNSSNERCPVCDRSFGPKAFDRHVEFCKEQRNRVQVHKSPAVVQQAKERLEARINYRVPPLRQSKRSLVRDKYSPSSQTNLLSRSNSIVSGKSTTSISSAVTTMLPNRRQISNASDKSVERNRKKEVVSKTRLDRTMGDCADSRELPRNENNSKSFHTKRTIPAKKINKTEINDGLQGIKVSSLCVEKEKKLVTWKDTVKDKPKVAPSISLTSKSVKKGHSHVKNEEESVTSRNLNKTPFLGKIVRSKVLMEKLNKYVSKPEPDYTDGEEEHDLFTPEKTYKMKDVKSEKQGFFRVVNTKSSLDACEMSELTHISEEGELEEESPRILENYCMKIAECSVAENNLNITQDIENSVLGKDNLRLMLNNVDQCSNTYSISSDTSEKEYGTEMDNEDSGDDTKTEDTSSLCLRLPLEGLESKVKLRNNDLDPDKKLKKNIKGFYEIMKTRRSYAARNREQLFLLENTKELTLKSDFSPRIKSCRVSPIHSYSERSKVDKSEEEEDDICEVREANIERIEDCKKEIEHGEMKKMVKFHQEIIPKLETNQMDKAPTFAKNGNGSAGEMDDCSIKSDKTVISQVPMKKAKTWKRRKKVMKCRMCKKCFDKNIEIRKWKTLQAKISRLKEFAVETKENSDFHSDLDSSQTLEEASDENLTITPGLFVNVIFRKSKSAEFTTMLKPISFLGNNPRHASVPGVRVLQSLPNINVNNYNCYEKKSACHQLSDESSFDKVVPRKRRKISPSFLPATSDEEKEKIEKSLKQNISEIRRKKKEEPPLILDYKKIGVCGSRLSADLLYMNDVFTSSVTPERSELASVNEFEDDEIQEYGDEVLQEWEAAEEELQKEIERNKSLARCESPTKLPTQSIRIETETINKSAKSLKNCSAYTIVNVTKDGTNSEKLPIIENCDENSNTEIIEMLPFGSSCGAQVSFDKIPCRLPRIIQKDKHSTPLKSMKVSAVEDFKLPAMRKVVSMKDICVGVAMPSDKLVQVPSRDVQEQQTSKIMIDSSSSFNREDSVGSTEVSPDAQKNKNNRRFGTSSMTKQTGMEFRKALAEEDVSSKEEPLILNRTPTAEELYPDNPMMYEEFRKYEEMYRREKEGRSDSSKKQRKKTADYGINIDDTSKTYEDSAYGSLNRKQQIEDHESPEQVEKLDISLHPAAATPVEKLPKYCHECGNKYPVHTAKFCVECGVKRLIL